MAYCGKHEVHFTDSSPCFGCDKECQHDYMVTEWENNSLEDDGLYKETAVAFKCRKCLEPGKEE